jgi:hypothetical protein
MDKSPVRARRTLTFLVAAGAPVVLALDNGGYETVTRGTLGVVVWAVIALGFAFGFLPRGRPVPAAWVALGSFAAMAAWTAIALTWTESSGHTFEELARVLQYGGLVALAYFSLNRHTWRAAAGGLATAALVVPLLSIAARLDPSLIVDHTAKNLGIDRLSYPFGYWNAVAAWGAMAIAVGLAWSAHARSPLTRSLALAALPAVGLSVYLSYSRAGAAAVVLAVVVAIVLGRNRWTTFLHAAVAAGAAGLAILAARNEPEIAHATGGAGGGAVLLVLGLGALSCVAIALTTRFGGVDDMRMPRRAARASVALGAIVVILGAVAAHHPLSRGWEQFKGQETVVTTGNPSDPAARLTNLEGSRYQVWTSAIHAFDSDPVRGIGPGSFEFFWARDGDSPEYLRDAHSLYLENLAELGVPGLLIIVALMGGLLAAGLTARRHLASDAAIGASAAAIAAFVVFLAYAGVDWMWELSAVGTLALGSAAVAGAAGSGRWGSSSIGLPARLVAIAVAIVAFGVQIPPLVSTQRRIDSADQVKAGNLDRARTLANQSIDAEPWSAAPYVQRALVEEAQGDLPAAGTDLRNAVDHEPTNWAHHFLLADLAAREGDPATVRSELAAVRRLAPGSLFLLPGVLLERRRIDEALGLTPAPLSPG